jgi:hypothetical protein
MLDMPMLRTILRWISQELLATIAGVLLVAPWAVAAMQPRFAQLGLDMRARTLVMRNTHFVPSVFRRHRRMFGSILHVLVSACLCGRGGTRVHTWARLLLAA